MIIRKRNDVQQERYSVDGLIGTPIGDAFITIFKDRKYDLKHDKTDVYAEYHYHGNKEVIHDVSYLVTPMKIIDVNGEYPGYKLEFKNIVTESTPYKDADYVGYSCNVIRHIDCIMYVSEEEIEDIHNLIQV